MRNRSRIFGLITAKLIIAISLLITAASLAQAAEYAQGDLVMVQINVIQAYKGRVMRVETDGALRIDYSPQYSTSRLPPSPFHEHDVLAANTIYGFVTDLSKVSSYKAISTYAIPFTTDLRMRQLHVGHAVVYDDGLTKKNGVITELTPEGWVQVDFGDRVSNDVYNYISARMVEESDS